MSVLTWPDEGISVLVMTTTAATQESKVTLNTVIDASQVQEGDKIKVTYAGAGDRTNTYEGVANHFEEGDGGRPRWRTAMDYVLFTDLAGVVIELLDRPSPSVPNKNLAIVQYQYTAYEGATPQDRTAVRAADGRWTVYDIEGRMANLFDSDESLAKYLGKNGDFDIAFGGVAK